MGKVRWTGWMMAIATAFVISGVQSARADVASDKPAAIVVYPKIVVDSSAGVSTAIRLTNTNTQAPVYMQCFYTNANSHCSKSGKICGVIGLRKYACGTPDGTCTAGWLETDFHIVLTPGQPVEWDAGEGLLGSGLPIPHGVCIGNRQPCGSNQGCLFPPNAGGFCTFSNAGTAIPPVAEDPFVGELRCIVTNNLGQPIPANDVKGEAIIETLAVSDNTFDVASYNAIGIQATGNEIDPNAPLTLGPGSSGGYNGCPGTLILNHFFEGAIDPVDSAAGRQAISTDLTLVPCTVNYKSQVGGTAVAQYLVFNEFEQRMSTSNTVSGWREINLCNIDTTQCSRSIFGVGVQGTLTGQTRVNPVATSSLPTYGFLGVAIERHGDAPLGPTAPFLSDNVHSAAFNLHFSGSLVNPDTITLP